jgi:hypothetical protein
MGTWERARAARLDALGRVPDLGALEELRAAYPSWRLFWDTETMRYYGMRGRPRCYGVVHAETIDGLRQKLEDEGD